MALSKSKSPWAAGPTHEDPRWKPCASIKVRYPKLEGNAMQDRVFQDYLLSTDGDQRLPFFTEAGVKVFERHRINNRNLGAWREYLVRQIMSKGYHEGVRGQAWAVPSDTEASKYLLISHATLTEAIYLAAERDKDHENDFVQRSLRLGLVAKVFEKRTPEDVLTYLKQLHNEFHRGAATSYLELIEACIEIEKGFAKYINFKGLKARTMPRKGNGAYIKVYWTWLQENHPGLFRNWTQFFEMKSFVRGLTRAGLLKHYQEEVADTCNFANPKLSNATLISTNKKLFTMVYENFVDTIPQQHLDFAMMCALRMAYPGMPKSDDELEDDVDPKWVFDKPETIAMISVLKCPMSGSAIYSAAKKKSHQKEARGGKPGGRGKSGKGKGKGKIHSRRSLRKQKSDPKSPGGKRKYRSKQNSKALKKQKVDLKRVKAENICDAAQLVTADDADDAQDADPALGAVPIADDACDHGEFRKREDDAMNVDSGEEEALALALEENEELDNGDGGDPFAAIAELEKEEQALAEMENKDEGDKATAGDAERSAETKTRPKMFLDDVYSAINSVTSHVPTAKWNSLSLIWGYSTALEFAFTKSIKEPLYSHLVAWSRVREAIKDRLVNDHRAHLPVAMVSSSSNTASEIVKAVKKAETIRLEQLETEFNDDGRNAVIKGWLEENDLEMPVMMLPSGSSFQKELFQACLAKKKSEGRKLNTADVVQMASSRMSGEFNTARESVAPLVCEIYSQPSEAWPIAKALFECPNTAQAFCQSRAIIASESFRPILEAPAVMESPVPCAFLSAHMEKLAAIDVHKKTDGVTDSESWTKFWMDVFDRSKDLESLQAFLVVEMQVFGKRRDELMKKLEEEACKAALSEASAAKGEQDPKQMEENEDQMKGLMAISEVHSTIAQHWEALIPLDDDDQPKFEFKIDRTLRLTLFEVAAAEIKCRLLENAFDKSKCGADTCTDEVFVDNFGIRQGAFCRNGIPGMRLNFTGEVSIVPTIGSLKLCNIDNVDLFLRCSNGKGPRTGYTCVAWDVRTVSAHQDTGKPLEDASMTFHTQELKVELTWAAKFLGASHKYLARVKLPFLKLASGYEAKSNFELTRPWDESMEVFSIDAHIKAYKAKATEYAKDLKEKTGTGASALKKQWAVVAKHLVA